MVEILLWEKMFKICDKMNKWIKKILLGLIVWAVPFFASFFVWDVKANAPKISMAWFSALMALTWAIGFAIAAYLYFKNVKKNNIVEGWTTGLIWYAELLILDLIILVGSFGMNIGDFYPMLLTYANSIVICAAIGYIKK
jgi:hypothetical protein